MGIQFDGINNEIKSQTKIDFPGSVGVAGTLTYEDVANVDSIGIITARTGINIGPTAGVAGTFFADGSYVTAGIITAATFHGSGANLTSLPAQATIANNADNRVITGGSGVNLNGEANLTFDGTNLKIGNAGTDGVLRIRGAANSTQVSISDNTSATLRIKTATGALGQIFVESGQSLVLGTDNTERLRITSDGNLQFNTLANGKAVILKSTGNYYNKLSFDSGNTSAGGELAYIDFKWDGDKVADIYVEAGSDTTNKDDGHLVFRTSPAQGSITSRLRIQNNGVSVFGDNMSATSGDAICEFKKSSAGGIQSRIQIENTSNNSVNNQASISLKTPTAGTATVSFYNQGEFYISCPYSSSYFMIYLGGSTALQIDSNKHLKPGTDNAQDLGSSSKRWRNLYINDLKLSNESKKDTGGNDVDGTWGDWTLQEGESDVFMINNRSGKKFKIKMEEVS